MFYYIPQIIFFAAIIVIIWLLAKNWPKVKGNENITDLAEDIQEGMEDLLAKGEQLAGEGKKILKKLPIEKMDAQVNGLLEKALRKARIGTMKLDGYLQKSISSVKNNSKPKVIFKAEEENAPTSEEAGVLIPEIGDLDAGKKSSGKRKKNETLPG